MLNDRQEDFIFDNLKKIQESLDQQTKYMKALSESFNTVFTDKIKENTAKEEKRKQEEIAKKRAIKDQFIEEWKQSNINTGDIVTIEMDDQKAELFIVKYTGNTNIKGYVMAYTKDDCAFECYAKDVNALGEELAKLFAPQIDAKIIRHDRKATRPVRNSVYRIIRRK